MTADFMQRMGFDQTNTPWVAVRHQDTDKDHIHIVASR
ncbi:relaxase/mobilization nuclease domain-containing protein, partial [Aeromonas caviae]